MQLTLHSSPTPSAPRARPTAEQIAAMSAPTPLPEHPPIRADMVDYASLDALRGAQLVQAIGALSARGHVAHRYSEASDELFANIDDPSNTNRVLDAYTGVEHLGVQDRETAWPRKLSVEHTWPRSKGAHGTAEADLHHLRAADKTANGQRSSFPFGEVVGTPTYETSPDAPWRSQLGRDAKGRVTFEPPDAVKGDIARGMLYFAARYATGLPDAEQVDRADFLDELPTLIAWHEQDPVTDAERARNDRVARFQGNRNAFVDRPELVAAAGADGFRAAVSVDH